MRSLRPRWIERQADRIDDTIRLYRVFAAAYIAAPVVMMFLGSIAPRHLSNVAERRRAAHVRARRRRISLAAGPCATDHARRRESPPCQDV
jgi:hypothetical protein